MMKDFQIKQNLNFTSAQRRWTSLSRLKLFLALSRTPHALLDMTTPGLAALLWLGALPPLKVISLGFITAFSGYTAVYALNDVMDHRVDRKKAQEISLVNGGKDLDRMLLPHPIARGLLSFREGLSWVIGWAFLSLLGAWILNPVCATIFLAGCAMEAIYCLMWKISHLRTIVSGAVKTSGGMAAVFAVDPNPSLSFLTVLFLWLFFWEIGGQNIPNDWIDIEEDRRVRARTVPVQCGSELANAVILSSLTSSVVLSIFLLHLGSYEFEWPYMVIFLILGIFFLLLPAYQLFKSNDRLQALALFNRASYYPLALLIAVGAMKFLIQKSIW